MTVDFESGYRLLMDTPVDRLLDRDFIEHELLIRLGLNNENVTEQPNRLKDQLGKGYGWRIWQYPNQFARYMQYFVEKAPTIDRYIEIGVRHGGTFALTTTLLKRFNPNFKAAVAVDLIDCPPLIGQMVGKLPILYVKGNSRSPAFAEWLADKSFDLALIDGDHSYDGVLNDFRLMRERSRIMVFHDVNSRVCPGVVQFWRALQAFWSMPGFEISEFLDTYDDTPVAGPYLGIGVVEKKAA